MPGLDPGIHVFALAVRKAWMAGSSPAMTENEHYAFRSFSFSKMLPKMPLGRKMMNSTKSTP
jgi:hypothetical protein